MLGSYAPYARVAICTQTKIHAVQKIDTIVQFIRPLHTIVHKIDNCSTAYYIVKFRELEQDDNLDDIDSFTMN